MKKAHRGDALEQLREEYANAPAATFQTYGPEDQARHAPAPRFHEGRPGLTTSD